MSDSLARTSGVLLHPTSLPGPFGVGDLGPVAYRWIETLAAAKQTWWQILPLGPTGFGDSPYQSFSAFAGSLSLLSPELLARDGLVNELFWAGQTFDEGTADFDRVGPFKRALAQQAFEGFRASGYRTHAAAFDDFCHANGWWLDDYAAFMALRGRLGGASLADWPADVRRYDRVHETGSLKSLDREMQVEKFGQFLFARQLTALRQVAADHKIKLMGDIPIFVSGDSADVWANPRQFLVDHEFHPTVVAGVPPDYFAEDGQHWGNPIYDWPAMAADGYKWWVARVRHALTQVDLVRLDHFRGFVQAWHIPAGEKTARNGKWVDGPGAALFTKLRDELGGLPFIAEDLGLITPDVVAVREAFRLPGMRVLQFAAGSPTNLYQPHNYTPATAVYTGTHDNDTTAGWWSQLPENDKKWLGEYVGHPVHDPAWEMIRVAWASVAAVAIAPLQDLLALGTDARMNVPGKAAGNWRWRVRYEQFFPGLIERLAEMTERYNRVPAKPAGNIPQSAGSS